MTLVKWKGEDAYLLDEGIYAPRRYLWTPNPEHGTKFPDEEEATLAFAASGAGDVRYLELVETK